MWRCKKKMFKKEEGQIDMVSLILTVVIAAVTMMVGLVVVANMESSMPDITTSVLSTSMTSVMENTGTAFNFLALGLFVLAAVFIIGIVAGVLGNNR
jgi:lipoprotein signal peptidase